MNRVSITCVVLLAAFATALPAAGSAAVTSMPGQRSLQEALVAQLARAAETPGDSTVLNDLANLQVLAGLLDEAEANYRTALGLDPNNLTVRLNLGLLLQQKGERRKALKEYRRVAEEEPSNAWAFYQIGSVYAEWGLGSRAVKNFARSFSLDLRMTQPEYNPQVINNKMATRALISAYKDHPIVPLVPRTYSEPSLIRGFFVPTIESMNGSRSSSADSRSRPEPADELRGEAPERDPDGDGYEDEDSDDGSSDDGGRR